MLNYAGSKAMPTSMRNSFQRPGCIGVAPDSHRCHDWAVEQTRAAHAACVMPTRMRRARICSGVGDWGMSGLNLEVRAIRHAMPARKCGGAASGLSGFPASHGGALGIGGRSGQRQFTVRIKRSLIGRVRSQDGIRASKGGFQRGAEQGFGVAAIRVGHWAIKQGRGVHGHSPVCGVGLGAGALGSTVGAIPAACCGLQTLRAGEDGAACESAAVANLAAQRAMDSARLQSDISTPVRCEELHVAVGTGLDRDAGHFLSPVTVTAPCCIHGLNIYHRDRLCKGESVTVAQVETLC